MPYSVRFLTPTAAAALAALHGQGEILARERDEGRILGLGLLRRRTTRTWVLTVAIAAQPVHARTGLAECGGPGSVC